VSPLFPVALLAAMSVESAYALESGNIQGYVEDETGAPIPGAEVVLGGAEMAGDRRMTTGADGEFRFDQIPPGNYEITVLFKGATVARAAVRVALSTTTTVPIPAKMGGISEELEVIGFKPVIDTTSSSFSTSVNEDTIQNLPVGRDFEDVVNTIPGVSGRIDTQNGGPGAASPSVRGEGGYGNNYMIDGVSTRDPATKGAGMGVNFDAIEEIQVYTDGAPAEYGQFTGMMVNVVTKDGGNEHHGSIAMFYSQHAWFDSQYLIYSPDDTAEIDQTKQKFRLPELAITAGGPIIEDKLWYFGTVGLTYSWARPEGLGEEAPAQTATAGNILAKATWFANDALTFRYIFTGSNSVSSDFDGGPLVAPEATSNAVRLNQSHRINATFSPDDKNTLELRLGYLNQNIDVRPSLGEPTVPSRVDGSGVLHDNANQTDLNDRNRLGGSVQYIRFLDDILGDHRFKLGADYWFLSEKRDIQNTGETQIEWIDSDGNPTGEMVDVGTQYIGSGEDFPCQDAVNYSDCALREHWTNVGPLSNTVRTYSAFIQDDWEPIKQLNFNLGVRVDIEDGRNDVGDRPITQSVDDFLVPFDERQEGELGVRVMPAPRLGFALDPWADGKTKFSGFYGQFYDLAGNNLWSWANARSANGFVRYVRPAPGEDFMWSNTQDPEGHPLIYAEDLKPARMDKLNLAVEREIMPDLSIGLRGILSKTTNIPEDVDVNLDDWYIMNSPIKERRYRALELTVNKQFDEVWQIYGAYTLQESYGHLPGQFELASGANSGSDGNNVGVYLDDIGDRETRAGFYEGGAGWILEGFKGLGRYSPAEPEFYDEAGWYGYLPYHSFHAIKLNGSYTAPFGTTFGLVYEFDSGHAWEKKTLVPFYGYDAFGQGRGSRFMPAVHYVDMRIAHKIGLGDEDRSLEATLDIFNVPGFAQSITYWTNDEPGFGSTLNRQAPRSVRLGLKYRY
jgi:hypothetical protein